MGLPIKDDRRYTYADYLSWDDGKRWELIDGVAYCLDEGPSAMSPGPSRRHQTAVGASFLQIAPAVQGKGC